MAFVVAETPFSLAYDALYTAFTSSADVTAIFDTDNIIRHDRGSLTPLIDSRNVGDLPSLDIIPTGGGDQNLKHTSDTAMFLMGVSLLVSTSEERLAAPKGLWAVRYAISKAMFQASTTLGSNYVEQWNLGAFTDGIPGEGDIDFGIDDELGWHSTADLVLTLIVPHDELK